MLELEAHGLRCEILYIPDLQLVKLCLFYKFTYEETPQLGFCVTECSVTFVPGSHSIRFAVTIK